MFVVKEPKKTSKKHQNSIVPISLKLKELLAKYGGLPPKIAYQIYRRNLKFLGKLFNINNLLSHSGRRTFGNEYLNSGFSETATATAMGHSDFKTTAKHYAVVQIERIYKELEGKEGF
jgi:integrase